MQKYHARAATYGGQRYPSEAEARYAQTLDLLKAAGEIHCWRRGEAIPLACIPERHPKRGHARGCVTLRPDFIVCRDAKRTEAVEIKGARTEAWTIKQRLWAIRYPTWELKVIPAKDVR